MTKRWDETELAPAKINLALHVTGRLPNGFHTLETLVTFADQGDVVYIKSAEQDAFSVGGRFGDALIADDEIETNLVLRARDGLREAHSSQNDTKPVHIHLEKNLPIASGVGGGSADAAATLRALMRHWNTTPPQARLDALSLQLGADVPMCLAGRPLLARGVGEEITFIEDFPSFSMILANPLIEVSTPDIFRRLKSRENAPLPALPEMPVDWLPFIATLRNDLEPPARELVGEIGEVTKQLKAVGAAIARMSGSGATCFGLFTDPAQADAAMASLEAACPGWYFLRTNTVQERR